ncbi:unnamed protein product [Hanseniaspora opuntiae]|jgi:hypothetical protein
MSSKVHEIYKSLIKENHLNDLNDSIEKWYIQSCVLNDKSKFSNIFNFLTTLEDIKADGNPSESISIPILSNQVFKGIFKKQSGKSSFYTSFVLRQYQRDGKKLIKEYKYDRIFSKSQPLEIVQLSEIYDLIEVLISDVKSFECVNEQSYTQIKDKLYKMSETMNNIVRIFTNEDNHGISLTLDKNLSIEIYLKRDSMVVRFKLKNSVTTIGYINDPFLINMYSKLMHIHDSLDKIIYNLNEIS